MMGHPLMQVKIASEPWEFEQIHALNHQTFTGEIPQHAPSPSGRLVDRFHEDNVYVIGVRERRVAGMIAIRRQRPFSLDHRLPNLDEYLPEGRAICELRLLAIEKGDRRGRLLPAIFDYVWRYCLGQGFDLAVISATNTAPLDNPDHSSNGSPLRSGSVNTSIADARKNADVLPSARPIPIRGCPARTPITYGASAPASRPAL